MPNPPFSVSKKMLLISCISAALCNAATASTLEMPSVDIQASADATAGGLSEPYAGEQVARGGRVGVLGNRDYMDSPFTTTAYTSKLLENQQARSVSDVVQNDPSVRTARGFGNFQELYVMRGFPLYSDDISYNGLYGLLPRQYVAAELIERVEVSRGANAFLNGAAPGGSGIGGSINLLPKRAPNEDLTRITTGIEHNGHGLIAADMARRLGENQQFGLRLNVAKRAGQTSVDDEKRALDVASLGLDYQGDAYRISADVGYQNHNIDAPRPSVTPNGAIPDPADAGKNFAQKWTYSEEKQTFGTLRAEFDHTDSITSWVAAGMRQGHEANRLANPSANANGITSAYRFDNVRKEEVATGEAGLRLRHSTGPVSHTWVLSAATFNLDARNAYAFSNFAGFAGNLYDPVTVTMPAANFYTGGSLSDPHVTERTQTRSVAIADTLGLIDDNLLLTVGMRRQQIDAKTYNYNSGALGSNYSSFATTPVAGVVYRLTHQTSLYANYIEGLTKGDIAPATSGGTVIANAGEALSPYVSKQTEVGVKHDAGSLGGSIALFSTKRPFSTVSNGVFGDGGEQLNRGLELSVFGEATSHIRLLGGMTLLDARLKKTQGGINEDNYAIGVPKVQANLGSEWDISAIPGLTLTGRIIHTGMQYADTANTLEVPSWTRFDLGARYAFTLDEQKITLRTQLDNATGRDYWASTGGYPNANYLVLGAPRTLSVSATTEF